MLSAVCLAAQVYEANVCLFYCLYAILRSWRHQIIIALGARRGSNAAARGAEQRRGGGRRGGPTPKQAASAKARSRSHRKLGSGRAKRTRRRRRPQSRLHSAHRPDRYNCRRPHSSRQSQQSRRLQFPRLRRSAARGNKGDRCAEQQLRKRWAQLRVDDRKPRRDGCRRAAVWPRPGQRYGEYLRS